LRRKSPVRLKYSLSGDGTCGLAGAGTGTTSTRSSRRWAISAGRRRSAPSAGRRRCTCPSSAARPSTASSAPTRPSRTSGASRGRRAPPTTSARSSGSRPTSTPRRRRPRRRHPRQPPRHEHAHAGRRHAARLPAVRPPVADSRGRGCRRGTLKKASTEPSSARCAKSHRTVSFLNVVFVCDTRSHWVSGVEERLHPGKCPKPVPNPCVRHR